ncbi:TetR/AcrR family transcriptional regulator C-terminal domain-containing protein [Arthrobacter sp. Helios]|uniref:TetR/AcrR family transcriptional regulator C-terminal domain-containing protein n=1 Tax=Arthrobacter sp. Helios TaxID=2828862 RepID=UPI00205DF865|nr:TetR/AcrR family transcriptional regulator C-terminal domain-containing protein [Arthrobacter sp. Helios]UPO76794.1 TetR/AcrR family transcriptional regulator C-terminal domain-containing protein [Arthrobacter sp. Helios]
MARSLPLHPDTIAAAAVRIADAEGLDAVSMRRVAGTLGVSAMALYRHVADRRALLLLMADAAKDFALLPPGVATWQATLEHMADAQWQAFQAHPWLLHIVLTPRRLVNLATPGEVELLLARLRGAGITEEQGFDCLLGISAAVIGTASITAAAQSGPEQSGPDDHAQWNSGAVARFPLAARFQDQGISSAASRRSLDFVVANFIRGVEQALGQFPGSAMRPVSWKEENATEG